MEEKTTEFSKNCNEAEEPAKEEINPVDCWEF